MEEKGKKTVEEKQPQEVKQENELQDEFYTAELPSRGFRYGGAIPGGKVKLRLMTTKEERLLTSKKRDVSILEKLMQACLVDCPVPVEKLYGPDRMYLLLVIRNINFRPEYVLQFKCQNCGFTFDYTMKVPDDLQMRVLTADDPEHFEVTLPFCKKKVTLKLLTGEDEAEIRKYADQAYRNTTDPGDPAYFYRLARHIIAIDGKEVPILEALELVEGMKTKDASLIREKIRENDFGVDMVINTDCPKCGYENRRVMGFTADFFR